MARTADWSPRKRNSRHTGILRNERSPGGGRDSLHTPGGEPFWSGDGMVVFSVEVKKDNVQHLFYGWGDRIGPLKNEQKVECNYKGFLPSVGRKHLNATVTLPPVFRQPKECNHRRIFASQPSPLFL